LGVQLQDIIQKRKVNLSYLSNRNIAIDAHNALYQFLSVIRGMNGVPLKNRRGEITSHLSGLFYRNINFMETGIKPIYVFDGKPPRLKKTEIERRKSVKEQAIQKYEKALEIGDFEEARIHAQATSRLNKQMIKDSKRLLTLMGIQIFRLLLKVKPKQLIWLLKEMSGLQEVKISTHFFLVHHD